MVSAFPVVRPMKKLKADADAAAEADGPAGSGDEDDAAHMSSPAVSRARFKTCSARACKKQHDIVTVPRISVSRVTNAGILAARVRIVFFNIVMHRIRGIVCLYGRWCYSV